MEPVIPLISSDTEGPLGVKHLPRLWLKTLLASVGRLPEGYKDVRPGFDYLVLEGLKVDPDAARVFITGSQPSYLAFESWLRRQPGVDLSPENVTMVNQLIAARRKPAETRRSLLAESGLSEDAPVESAVMLNNLDDWRIIHALIGSPRDGSAPRE